jgi:hypothetical protein
MKMRHRAIPGNPQDQASSIPIDQRLHLEVRVDGEAMGEKERPLWFRKVPSHRFPLPQDPRLIISSCASLSLPGKPWICLQIDTNYQSQIHWHVFPIF